MERIKNKTSHIIQKIIICPSCKNSYKISFSDNMKYKTCSTSCLLKYNLKKKLKK